ncbi:MICAL-like protein 2 [Caerostris extrusa]|uniref:MICAL-like protein 2 n=1 Tax=Caerostris extrusa TaxID=172846 RepID=A0AAV4YA43_CAEEX|nr:MICAL-like protein 2 [Caerostris extrusa]
MDSQARGLIKGLENWAKRITTGYKDVNVQNMSSSFRDGLAFCAIIHHYRPDLIDFESLSRTNILENNSLAFSVAERQLGVPALLDAEDMVQHERPDRLSIITYLSQLHNCFENQNRVKTLKNIKRPQNNSAGPPSKVAVVQPKLLVTKRHEVCHACNHRVFILERLIVDNKLYHTACFRCNKCNCLLNPGAYVESDTPGLYECAVCLPEESSMDTQDTSYDSSEDKNGSLSNSSSRPPSPVPRRDIPTKSTISETVDIARNSFLQRSLTPKSPELKKLSPLLRNGTSSPEDGIKRAVKKESEDNGISVKDKISAFESNRNSRLGSFGKSYELSSSNTVPSNASNSASRIPSDSPRTSVFSVSSPNATEFINKKGLNEKNLPSSTVDGNSSNETLKTSLKLSSRKNEISNSQSDKLDCDNSTLTPILNKVPNTSFRHSLDLDSLSKQENTSKISPTRQFQIGEYKSPFRTSRDIFQTSLQPLKLGIPAANSTPKKESSSLPVTPITGSSDSLKISSVEIPQIRSTYAKTLPRPGSDGDLLPEDKKPNSKSERDLSNVPQSKWSITTPRRSSLESYGKSTGVSIQENSITSGSTQNSSITSGSTKSLEENAVGAGKEIDSKYKFLNTLSTSSLRRDTSPYRRQLSEIPVPSVRHSLEIKSLTKSPEPKVGTTLLSESSEKPAITIQPVETQKSKEQISKNEEKTAKSEVPETPEKIYPTDLNPFGDDDEGEVEYPDDLNPFGDDDDEGAGVKVTVTNDYDESKNPFASDDDDDEKPPPQPKSPPPRPAPPQTSSPFRENNWMSSPTGSLKGTTKKRLAPKPPRVTDIFPNDSQDSEADASFNSVKSSPTGSRVSLRTPSPKLRKSKPAPLPPGPPSRQSSQADVTASSKQMKDADNMKLKSSASDEAAKQQVKKKKRPAPPVPIPKRKDNKKIPLKEIIREMKEIEEKQRECERQGREIEILIRDRDKDEEPTVEEEENIMQLFELVNQKNALFRRQAELMYIKRSQRLEEQQANLEMKIRQLMEKPEAEKNDDDKVKEEELILELMDIVDQRDCIINSIEMDRRRELEEDASVQEQIEIKNGDLPITAEIKEKNTGKAKKEKKAKKDKKDKKKAKDKDKKKNDGDDDEHKKSSKKKGLFR